MKTQESYYSNEINVGDLIIVGNSGGYMDIGIYCGGDSSISYFTSWRLERFLNGNKTKKGLPYSTYILPSTYRVARYDVRLLKDNYKEIFEKAAIELEKINFHVRLQFDSE